MMMLRLAGSGELTAVKRECLAPPAGRSRQTVAEPDLQGLVASCTVAAGGQRSGALYVDVRPAARGDCARRIGRLRGCLGRVGQHAEQSAVRWRGLGNLWGTGFSPEGKTDHGRCRNDYSRANVWDVAWRRIAVLNKMRLELGWQNSGNPNLRRRSRNPSRLAAYGYVKWM
jgi:hypothetical protein